MPSQTSSPKSTLAISVAVWHHDAILLIRHAKSPNKGLWTLPGGKVRNRETLQQAAQRELFEETSLKADIVQHVTHTDIFAEGKHYRLHCFLAKNPKGELEAGSDALEAAWMSYVQIPTLDRVANLESIVGKCKQLV